MANGITKITVQGFKSLYDETSIEIRPLTILAGANSSGKSSIMQPLLLMKQTLEASYNPAGPFVLDGANVRFTSTEQFLLKIGRNTFSKMLIKLEAKRHQLQLQFERVKGKFQIREQTYASGKQSIHLYPNITHDEIWNQIPERERTQIVNLNKEYWNESQLKLKAERNRFLLEIEGAYIPATVLKLNLLINFEDAILALIHVPGLRNQPARTYKMASSVAPLFPGTFDSYMASIVAEWRNSTQLKHLIKYLKQLQLTSKIEAQPIDETQIELRVSISSSENPQKMVSIADVGLGVSQVLPVLVALLVAEENQMVYIEQPELHLHPRAQVALAEILAEAANRGVRVVIETHSSLLLLGIQTLVAEGKLEPDKVMLHWFKRNEEGKTSVRSVQPDENGAYGDWPEDFGDVELNIQNRYLDAVTAHEATK